MKHSPARQIIGMLFPLVFICLISMSVTAQEYIYSVGAPRFTTALPVESGFINVPNGNLHLEIPLGSWPQRGTTGNFSASMVYDSRMWVPGNGADGNTWYTNNIPTAKGGWRLVTTADSGTVGFNSTNNFCFNAQGQINGEYTTWTSFSWTDPGGITHAFSISTERPNSGCGTDSPNGSAMASDGSQFYMNVTTYTNATVYGPNGIQIYPSVKDTNGNYFSRNANNDVIDTLGRTPVITVNNCNGNSNQTCYYVTNSQGLNSIFYTVTYETVFANTAFGVAGYAERSNYPVTVVQSIALPDGSSYQFGYDGYAEVSSVQLPTGPRSLMDIRT